MKSFVTFPFVQSRSSDNDNLRNLNEVLTITNQVELCNYNYNNQQLVSLAPKVKNNCTNSYWITAINNIALNTKKYILKIKSVLTNKK